MARRRITKKPRPEAVVGRAVTSPEHDFSGKGGHWGRNAAELKRLVAEYEKVPLDSLRPWKDNPRINTEAIPVVAELIKQHGFAGVVVATPDGVIRAGHTRYAALVSLQQDPDFAGEKGTVWVHWKNFPTETAAEAYALADNKSAERADWDHAKLARLFKQRNTADLETLRQFSGFKQREIDWHSGPRIDPEKLPDFEVPAKSYTVRIDNVDPDDWETVLELVNKALEDTGYAAQVY